MFIEIKGAKENNLKNIDLSIPKDKLIVFTGLSGSGKSTLALETLQRECQRQYMESMGMTMDIGSKPRVDWIKGLSPAISINQHQTSNNPRSTVGTVTEVAPYLRVIFAKLGERPCPHCGERILQEYNETETDVYSDNREGEGDEIELFEEMIPCPHCGKNVVELTASHFSFNKPEGACKTCHGMGVVSTPDVRLIMDGQKSIREFAIHGWDQVFVDRYGGSMVQAAKYYGFELDINLPVDQFNEVQRDLLLYGVLSPQFTKHFPSIKPPKTVPEGRFEGIVTGLMRRYSENTSESSKQKIEKMLIRQECPDCRGVRFREETLAVRVGENNIREILSMSFSGIEEWLRRLKGTITTEAYSVVGQVLEDILKRVGRILDAGAGYLNLDQPAASLSAGEWQRIKLSAVLGSGLTGVLYVLDEPTSGLHSRDTEKIISVLKRLRDLGNTVIVIEHDLAVMRAADYIIDFGPGAGKEGGRIVATGSVHEIMKEEASITGQYLHREGFRSMRKKLPKGESFLSVKNAKFNNLKGFDIEVPTGRFVTVTGVSGSGKTSFVFGCLAKEAEKTFEVIRIDQQSIGRSNRSNAATYTDLFTDIRDLFAALPLTKEKGLLAKHFSYNVSGGRCERCQGNGKITVSMHFLPDVEVICPACKGRRYQKPILEIKYHGASISDVLEMSIDEAMELFQEEKGISSKLKILQEVGLGYLGLGQSTTTLSGGEAQRLKLAKELSLGRGGRVMYLFDEPTTGLHPHDAERLIQVFDRLVQAGNSVIVIEHMAEMILESDYVIDLGPEGGQEGGEIVAIGTPVDIMKSEKSHTGKILTTSTR